MPSLVVRWSLRIPPVWHRKLHERHSDHTIRRRLELTFQDKTLVCRECGAEFLFTAGEQEFYQSRRLEHEPGRCPTCRAARKAAHSYGDGSPRPMHSIVCSSCGADAEVPFQPRMGKPVYCNDCFSSLKTS